MLRMIWTLGTFHLALLFSFSIGQATDGGQGCALQGPVKSVRIETSSVRASEHQTNAQSNKIVAQLDSYDRSGRLTESVHYSPDGSASWVFTVKYDSVDRKIEERECDTDDSSCIRYRYTYSRNGRRARVNEIAQDGSLIGWSANTYDANGAVVSISRYNRSGQMVYRDVYSYDRMGKKEKRVEVSYDFAAAPSHASGMWVYSYDSHERLAEERVYETPRGGILLSRVEYRYDDRGNLLLELIHKNHDTLAEQITYSSYEFDSHGNWVKRTRLRETIKDGRNAVQSSTSITRDISFY